MKTWIPVSVENVDSGPSLEASSHSSNFKTAHYYTPQPPTPTTSPASSPLESESESLSHKFIDLLLAKILEHEELKAHCTTIKIQNYKYKIHKHRYKSTRQGKTWRSVDVPIPLIGDLYRSYAVQWSFYKWGEHIANICIFVNKSTGIKNKTLPKKWQMKIRIMKPFENVHTDRRCWGDHSINGTCQISNRSTVRIGLKHWNVLISMEHIIKQGVFSWWPGPPLLKDGSKY